MMLAAWKPNRSSFMSKVMGDVSLKRCGRFAYMFITLSQTDDCETRLRSPKISDRKLFFCSLALRVRKLSMACSRMRYKSVVKFQPESQLVSCTPSILRLGLGPISSGELSGMEANPLSSNISSSISVG